MSGGLVLINETNNQCVCKYAVQVHINFEEQIPYVCTGLHLSYTLTYIFLSVFINACGL